MKYTKILICLLLPVALLRKVELPDLYNVVVANYEIDGNCIPYYLNDIIYALFNSVLLFLSTIIILRLRYSYLMFLLSGLAFGKIIDEFTQPFGYGAAEFAWDILFILYTTYTMQKNGQSKPLC